MSERISSAVLRRIEAMAIRGAERFWSRIPPAVAKHLRPRVTRVGDALLTLGAGSDALRTNRVIGLGHEGRARESMIDEIIAFYRGARLRRFSLMMSPGPQSDRIAGWLLARGFAPGGGHSLLVRDARTPVPLVRSAVRVARARRADVDAILAIHQRCFALPANRRAWSRAAFEDRGLEQYLAWVGATPVAAGALRMEDGLAWLGGGATLTRWRRHGAHAVLIAARLRRAARQGCRWTWVETVMPAPGRPTGSSRNLVRAGFVEACVKPIFVWHER
jgi:hypothetical protein